MGKQKDQVKCPWCGRMVCFSKKHHLAPHMQSGRVKCWGTGQPEETVRWLVESKAAHGGEKK